jgi:dihydroorotate dehydrogenase electron transfer subunit
MTLELPPDAEEPRPGQFFSIRCGNGTIPLLRRPFSLHDFPDPENRDLIAILYRTVGPGTTWMSERLPGESLDVLGPLGNGFRLDDPPEEIVLIARGIGIAPLYAVARYYLLNHPEGRISTLMGARTKERLFFKEELVRLGTLHTYTDDGTEGFKGKAPDLLCHLFENGMFSGETACCACGPLPMLHDLFKVSQKWPIHAQVALEAHMGCGFGACLSCAVPLKTESIVRDTRWPKPEYLTSKDGTRGISLACKDGPVYALDEVDWEAWLT